MNISLLKNKSTNYVIHKNAFEIDLFSENNEHKKHRRDTFNTIFVDTPALHHTTYLCHRFFLVSTEDFFLLNYECLFL